MSAVACGLQRRALGACKQGDGVGEKDSLGEKAGSWEGEKVRISRGGCGVSSERKAARERHSPDTRAWKQVSEPCRALTKPHLRQLSDGLRCPLASQWSG